MFRTLKIIIVGLSILGVSESVSANVIICKDTLVETSAGVALVSHTPTGTGATGSWTLISPTIDWTSYAGADFHQNNGANSNSYDTCGTSHLPAAGTTDYAQTDMQIISTGTATVGVALVGDASATYGSFVFFGWDAGTYGAGNAWKIVKQLGGVSFTVVASSAVAISTTPYYTIRLDRTISGSNANFYGYINGTLMCTATLTESYAIATSSGGLMSAFAVTTEHAKNFESGTDTGTASTGLTAGTLTNTFVSASSATFSIATNTGGTSPYSNQLKRSPTGAGTYTNIGSAVSGATAVFADTTVVSGTTYDYKVTVTDNISTTTDSNVITVVVPGGLTPGTLTNTSSNYFSASFSIATNSGGTSPYTNQLKRSPTGAGTYTNIGAAVSGTTAVFVDTTVVSNTVYDYKVTVQDSVSASTDSAVVTVSIPFFIAASSSSFLYSGRWGAQGSTMTTMTSGNEVRFGYTGNSCILYFDTSSINMVNFPYVTYWVDNVGPTRVLLTSVSTITINPAYNASTAVKSYNHYVRYITQIDQESSAYDDWTNLRDAVKFKGVSISNGSTLLPTSTNKNYIEFLGDSITASINMLYAGSSGLSVDASEVGWPEYVSQELNMNPIVNGHGYQSLTQASHDGTPAANAAFPYVYAGTAWNPTNKPVAVVIYQGTNGGTTSGNYLTFLQTIRAAYPNALIFAVAPYNQGLASTIQTAVTNMADNKVIFIDYSNVIVSADTGDGTHPNPGGAVKMAKQFIHDIQAKLDSFNIKTQQNDRSVGMGF